MQSISGKNKANKYDPVSSFEGLSNEALRSSEMKFIGRPSTAECIKVYTDVNLDNEKTATARY